MSSAAVVYIATVITTLTNCDPNYQLLMYFIFYLFAILSTLTSRIIWITSTTIGVVTMVLLLTFCFGSLKYANLELYGPYFNNTALYMNYNGTTDMNMTSRIVSNSGVNITQALFTPNMPVDTNDLNSFWFLGGMTGFLQILGWEKVVGVYTIRV